MARIRESGVYIQSTAPKVVWGTETVTLMKWKKVTMDISMQFSMLHLIIKHSVPSRLVSAWCFLTFTT